MLISELQPGQSAVLPDGSVVTRRFNGSFRVRGVPESPDDQQSSEERA